MKRALGCLLIVACGGLIARGEPTTEEAIAERLGAYLDAFNANDAQVVAAFWSEDAVSLNEETGERTEGRAALISEFSTFFKESPGARLTGEVTEVRVVRPDVVIAEGVATLFVPDADPTPSAFTAVLTKEDGKWVLESSQERDLPSPPSPSDALQDLAWLIGYWRDQTDGVSVATTVRWSPSKAFLIRSYRADYDDGGSFQGTQVIGWDPMAKQFRTWTFNSDGSFGEGVVSRSGEEWIMKMTQVRSDGGFGTTTQVITKVDDNTLSVEKIAQTIDGSPAPSSEPVTVVRVATATAEATE